ncbi:hypothetical protein [Zavarzinia sp. CC-PAN008]|uniref:hypothetical protein n=1 Tax=Zavarzinia sp. CC-PAN008 TaxID=3243332 RepID=UPI003F743294
MVSTEAIFREALISVDNFALEWPPHMQPFQLLAQDLNALVKRLNPKFGFSHTDLVAMHDRLDTSIFDPQEYKYLRLKFLCLHDENIFNIVVLTYNYRDNNSYLYFAIDDKEHAVGSRDRDETIRGIIYLVAETFSKVPKGDEDEDM